MNKIRIISILFAVMVISVQQLEAINLPQNWLGPLQAGYGYTQEEKDNACQEIAKLQQEKEDFLVQLNDIHVDINLSEQEKNEYFNSIASDIDKIDGDIKELQRITGDVWSENRKYAWGVVGLCGATFLTYKFGPSILSFIKKDNNAKKLLREKTNENALIIKKQEEKLAKQQKELDALRKEQELNKKRQEQIRKEVQRKAQEQQEEITQKITKARKNVETVRQKIDECIKNGQFDSDDDKAKLAQLNKQLEQENEILKQLESNAELCIYKEKERVQKEKNRAQHEVYLLKTKDQEERHRIMIENIENILEALGIAAKKATDWVVKETPAMVAAVHKYFQGMSKRLDLLTDFERELLINISFP